ncbi:MAG: hypothetical protein JW750_10765, partial [Anaerolineaceae bacterium]|nr:hypothetical protein [Anaerolineaceae bacterium]
MPYPIFDRSQLKLKPLSERVHDYGLEDILQLDADIAPSDSPNIDPLVERMLRARQNNAPVILLMGAHVIKRGMSRFIIDLMERGLVTHVGVNGAGSIHDTEFALIGHTSESVARYIMEGQFGLWQETGMVNEAAILAAAHNWGLGESIGRMIESEKFPNREISVLATGYRLKIPVTVHVGIGQDIVHEHPNFDGAAVGKASYRDFLTLAHSVSQ